VNVLVDEHGPLAPRLRKDRRGPGGSDQEGDQARKADSDPLRTLCHDCSIRFSGPRRRYRSRRAGRDRSVLALDGAEAS